MNSTELADFLREMKPTIKADLKAKKATEKALKKRKAKEYKDAARVARAAAKQFAKNRCHAELISVPDSD